MLKKLVTLQILTLAAMSLSAQAAVIRYHGKGYEVDPLAGSTWAKEHPGQLPYEKCFLTSLDNLDRENGVDFIFVGEAEYDYNPTQRLVCFSEKLKLGFMIPVYMGEMNYWGLRAAFPFSSEFVKTMGVYKLDGKRVSELFTKFKGIETSISVLGGIGGHSLKSHTGIKIKDLNGKMAIGVTLSHADMTMYRRTKFYGPALEGVNPLMLVSGTQEPRRMDDWFRVTNDPACPEVKIIDYTIDYTEMNDLEFVEIK